MHGAPKVKGETRGLVSVSRPKIPASDAYTLTRRPPRRHVEDRINYQADQQRPTVHLRKRLQTVIDSPGKGVKLLAKQDDGKTAGGAGQFCRREITMHHRNRRVAPAVGTRPYLPWILLLAALSLLGGCGEKPASYYQGYAEGEFVLVASPRGGRLDRQAVTRG
jgi:hypothetical protein